MLEGTTFYRGVICSDYVIKEIVCVFIITVIDGLTFVARTYRRYGAEMGFGSSWNLRSDQSYLSCIGNSAGRARAGQLYTERKYMYIY